MLCDNNEKLKASICKTIAEIIIFSVILWVRWVEEGERSRDITAFHANAKCYLNDADKRKWYTFGSHFMYTLIYFNLVIMQSSDCSINGMFLYVGDALHPFFVCVPH